jgi:hypothetical protein
MRPGGNGAQAAGGTASIVPDNSENVPDFTESARHIAALTGSADTPVTFQTFDDSQEKRGELAKWMHGTLSERADELASYSKRGAGVFITVNETDGRGRKAENIIALRALFVDSDGAKLPPLKVRPSFSVIAKRGPHLYFLLEPGEDLVDFKPAQKALIHHLGTDPSIHDLPRVMRLAGFPHQKAEAFQVRLGAVTGARYRVADMLAHYPPQALSPEPFQSGMSYRAPGDERVPSRILVERALKVAATDGRNHAGLWLACQLRDNGYDKGEAGSILLDYARSVTQQPHPYSEREAIASLHQAFSRPARDAWQRLAQAESPVARRMVDPLAKYRDKLAKVTRGRL